MARLDDLLDSYVPRVVGLLVQDYHSHRLVFMIDDTNRGWLFDLRDQKTWYGFKHPTTHFLHYGNQLCLDASGHTVVHLMAYFSAKSSRAHLHTYSIQRGGLHVAVVSHDAGVGKCHNFLWVHSAEETGVLLDANHSFLRQLNRSNQQFILGPIAPNLPNTLPLNGQGKQVPLGIAAHMLAATLTRNPDGDNILDCFLAHSTETFNLSRGTHHSLRRPERLNPAVAFDAMEERLYLIGGQVWVQARGSNRCGDGKWQGLTNVDRFDFRTRTWTSLCPLSIPRRGGAATFAEGFVFIFGGTDWHTRSIERYDPKADQWEILPTELPCDRVEDCVALWR